MQTQDFYFTLPKELIAKYPLANRTDAKLLIYFEKTQEYLHDKFKNIINFFQPEDLIVLNNTKVIKARLFGYKPTAGKIELLIERIVNENYFFTHIKNGKSLKENSWIYLQNNYPIQVINRHEELYYCYSEKNINIILQEIGHIPLPPYLHRTAEEMDLIRYQTIYAKDEGSIAAPTAGLHFDSQLLQQLKDKGINIGYLTLHVGSGTFAKIRCKNIKDHKMHNEEFNISQELCQLVNHTKALGKKIIAVGTTSLRALESSTKNGILVPNYGNTNIFIYPGFNFTICDGLITNFHLPESTLLMLVSAFIGYKETMKLYTTAIAQNYRFFSYGDTSLLLK